MQWSLAYLASAWLIVQLVDVLGMRWGVSEEMARLVDLVLLVGFFLVLVVAWYHGERGHQRVSGTELLIITGILATGALGLSFLDLSIAPGSGVAAADEYRPPAIDVPREIDAAPWVAVMPLQDKSDDAVLRSLADGLTTDITAGLSHFSHLLVLSPATVRDAVNETSDARQLGRTLGARYVLEGELRRSGDSLRATLHLTDSQDGTTVWSESFDRDLTGSSLFGLQDELADRIVATVGDVNGAVTRAMATTIGNKPAEELTPYEAILQWSITRQSASHADHVRSITSLERAVRLAPEYAIAWACLAHVYAQDYNIAYNELDDAMDLALAAARRAVELDPTDSLTQYALAIALYFRKDVDAFRAAAERAIELNPRDTQSMAMLGILIGYSGDWEASVELTTRAMELNPHHPGWYRFNTFFNEYRQHNYEEALDIALRINLPEYWGDALARALAYGQLGNERAARQAADDLERLWPAFAEEYYRDGLENWIYSQPELMRHTLDGLRKAGLDMRGPGSKAGS